MNYLSLSAAFLLGGLPVALAQLPYAPASTPAGTSAAAHSLNTADDLTQYKTADALWLHIQDIKKGPKVQPTTREEYSAGALNMITQLAAAASDFVTRFPDDPRKWDARLLQIEVKSTLLRMSGRPDTTAARAQLQALAAEKDAPASARGQASYQLFGLAMTEFLQGHGSVKSEAIVAQLRQFTTDFPTYPDLDVLKYKVAEALEPADPAASDQLLHELAASGQGDIADRARTQLAVKEKLKLPLDLHFTATDGTQVDIAKLRGRVVLVDFWATWAAPSLAELPAIDAAYKKYHPAGFEVIGISLDTDKAALTKFTSDHAIPWPEYFDGNGWKNAISSSFAIHNLPAMWLLNKKGVVVSTNARADLPAQIEKLLAEPQK